MPLIDQSYFVGELNIPSTANPSVLGLLNLFIAQHEEELLQSVMGYALWKAYRDGIAASSPDAKWTAIRDGAEYTSLQGYARKWNGLADATKKKSLIANYVYYWYMRDKASLTTIAGEVDAKTDVAGPVSAATKMCRAWNEMVLMIEELVLFLQAKIADYPEFKELNLCTLRNKFRPINPFNL